MSNEEAVKMLRTMQRTVYLGNRKFEDAIECAIKALSEPLQPWEVLAAQAVLSHPEPHEIGYYDCSNALLKMWMDNVLTDREYYRIADKLNEEWGKKELPEPLKGVTE